ncbi:MAG: bifunctional 3,4-dihydroxy-2-butanone-4-phosphate synthase/GTP cyclohydrolase II [Gammaproteobacteria bacterium]|nr:bifunctional 3,4-dihydroxy-2-butanone-4-phosphate synthase/GTP cyclohydrolase II [Gammaproteobacteria bacterium]MCW8839731.1 bifunctional 3,4-dihydroxy-2-butanone-4-phosphate synthase/GTP cyclohydrolase II [Gammaproteobacteria bacterium]MCW8958390.1 bifunctional 3,4-dihydroxy-2-butanone-4-phosphate synthase/GTP cyclohydrolase II [Gammaproteobacteria bacterium]MCW8973775.1 bifunctional 3,4-dihydroxy-2-butanone-4-phosphate synthase/GTP cyclohydrolase II [Gammaproteobacteria bacterium]MCW899159
MSLNSIEEIIDDIRQGKMVILMDDEDRENEGDLIIASSMIRPEDINFMARYGRGLICMTLTRERCQQLDLPLMVRNTNDKHGTNFTVSIEAAEGVTTGISAYDRAMTVRAAVAPNATPNDIVQPGHIFPLMAQAGGVLTRAGHTEAGCDLARLAGFEPSSVIVEILNEDGTMARRPDLEKFATEHGIKIGTVADLINYRLKNEPTVERVSECTMPTRYGEFRLVAYRDLLNHEMHMALVKGELDPQQPALVRVHLQNTLCDLFGNQRDCGWPLGDALRRINDEGQGVAIILRQQEEADALLRRIKDYEMQDKGVPVPEEEKSDDLRTYGIGAQILIDLGVSHMRVLSAPKKMHALSGFGLDVVEYVQD